MMSRSVCVLTAVEGRSGGNNCGLCVDPLDPKVIAQAVEYLLTHREEALRMGEHGRRAVEEKYNWEKEGEKLLNLYARLLIP